MTCACFPAVGCIFSLSRRYLLSAQTDTVYAWGEKHLGSNPGAAERRRNVPAAPGRAGDFTHTVCPAKNWESAAGQTCGDVGFKRWFRSLQTLYHSRQTRDICEIQNIHFRVVLESCVQCWGQVRGWETAKSSNILPVPEAKKIRTSYHIFVTWLVIYLILVA